MATINYNKIFGIKRTIWTSDSFYVQDEEIKEQYRLDVADGICCDPDELDEERLARYWYEDNEINYECERENLNKNIDGVIIALGRRWSHYGAICGNGREGTKIIGSNISSIMETSGDNAGWWTEDYNVHGRTADHDGSWSIVYRVCKNSDEAERLQELAYEGKLNNADIMARTKSLYPYLAQIYGWPYRGSNKAA